MPLPNSDKSKEKYSVDEMMEVIKKDKPRGTRKRRTHQPALLVKKRRKIWVIVTAVGLVLIGFTIVILHMLNRARIEGEIFRSSANRRFSSVLGCTVDFDRFRPQGWHDVDCPNVRFVGTKGVLKDALLTNLVSRMTPSSFFRNEWDINDLDIEQATIAFQEHRSPKRADDDPNTSLEAAKPDDSFRLGISAEPSYVSVRNLKIERLGISWPGAKGKQNRIEDLQVTGTLAAGVLTAEATSGRWVGGIWPEVPVEALTVTASENQLNISNVRLQITEKAEIRASGNIEFTKEGPSGELEVKIDPMQLKELLHPAWQKRLFGKLVVHSAAYRIKPGAPDEFVGSFTMDGLVVQQFPGLNALSQFFKNELYSKLEFRQVSGSFRRTDEKLIIENFNATRHGECKLSGSVTLHHDGKLEGDLKLALNTIEANLPQFAGEEDGLDVISVKLSGTETSPSDNLVELFKTTPTQPEGETPAKEEPGN